MHLLQRDRQSPTCAQLILASAPRRSDSYALITDCATLARRAMLRIVYRHACCHPNTLRDHLELMLLRVVASAGRSPG